MVTLKVKSLHRSFSTEITLKSGEVKKVTKSWYIVEDDENKSYESSQTSPVFDEETGKVMYASLYPVTSGKIYQDENGYWQPCKDNVMDTVMSIKRQYPELSIAECKEYARECGLID